jgi:hypothetical protein
LIPRKITLATLLCHDLIFGYRETDAVITMPAFTPQLVHSSYDFDIKRTLHGCWIARDRAGLSGGTFFSRKDAIRFALFEVGGDGARVHLLRTIRKARKGRAA